MHLESPTWIKERQSPIESGKTVNALHSRSCRLVRDSSRPIVAGKHCSALHLSSTSSCKLVKSPKESGRVWSSLLPLDDTPPSNRRFKLEMDKKERQVSTFNIFRVQRIDDHSTVPFELTNRVWQTSQQDHICQVELHETERKGQQVKLVKTFNRSLHLPFPTVRGCQWYLEAILVDCNRSG
jgi:hypothetical protein